MGNIEDAGTPAVNASASPNKKRKWIKYAVLIPVVLAILYFVREGLWALDFAEEHGCIVNEARIHPCIVDGKDWGEALGDKFIIVTMMSFMAPLVLLPFLLLFIFIFIFILKDTLVYIIAKVRGENHA